MQVDISRGGHIADPVHGYVDFTGIERVILEHPVTQRLRYISQNGLAHLVYPEARTSRFSHSLGAMHLASRFLVASLRNADQATRQALVAAIRDAVNEAAGKVSDPAEAAQAVGMATNLLVAHHYGEMADRAYIFLAEQGLRLAALFHDLGHLPFSHDFEYGLEDLWRSTEDKASSPLAALLRQQPGEAKIHERLGHRVALLLFQELFAQSKNKAAGEAARIVFEFAYAILETAQAPSPHRWAQALEWLHSIIDGELDVDRCDYILRDARNYGFEFAIYDLARLFDNVSVVDTGASFTHVVKPQGLSALESFLVARSRSYQYSARHHKVAQVGAALRYAVALILGSKDEAIQDFVGDLAAIMADDLTEPNRSAVLRNFARYDDIWWTTQLRETCDRAADEWLNLVCYRQRGPRSLWKRIEDFPRELPKWNEELPASSNLKAQERWFEAVAELRKEGVLIVRHDFKPWRSESKSGHSRLPVRLQSGKMQPVSELSPLVFGLQAGWMKDVQVHAFASSDNSITADDVLKRLEATFKGAS